MCVLLVYLHDKSRGSHTHTYTGRGKFTNTRNSRCVWKGRVLCVNVGGHTRIYISTNSRWRPAACWSEWAWLCVNARKGRERQWACALLLHIIQNAVSRSPHSSLGAMMMWLLLLAATLIFTFKKTTSKRIATTTRMDDAFGIGLGLMVFLFIYSFSGKLSLFQVAHIYWNLYDTFINNWL